jgi:hypothetical protein
MAVREVPDERTGGKKNIDKGGNDNVLGRVTHAAEFLGGHQS